MSTAISKGGKRKWPLENKSLTNEIQYRPLSPFPTRMALANDDKAYREVDKLTLKYCKCYGNEFKIEFSALRL